MAHGVLDQALQGIDPTVYSENLEAILKGLSSHIIITDALTITRGTGLEEFGSTLATMAALEGQPLHERTVALLGGSAACLALTKIPESEDLIGYITELEAGEVNSSLYSVAMNLGALTPEQCLRLQATFRDRYPALSRVGEIMGRYSMQNGYNDTRKTLVCASAIAINVALCDAANNGIFSRV